MQTYRQYGYTSRNRSSGFPGIIWFPILMLLFVMWMGSGDDSAPIVNVQMYAYEENVLVVTVTANGASDQVIDSIVALKLDEWLENHPGASIQVLPDQEFIDSQANVTRYYAITYR